MNKSINDYTLKEFQEMETFIPTKPFTWVIIVPMDDIHDSGYRCMKFILGAGSDILGVVYAGSDIVNPNGIGNYGRNWDRDRHMLNRGFIPRMDLSIDCLVTSNCVRLMLSRTGCELDSVLGSNFIFYVKDEE